MPAKTVLVIVAHAVSPRHSERQAQRQLGVSEESRQPVTVCH